MEKRVLGKTGLEVVCVGFGGIPIQRVDQEKVTEIVDEMSRIGINFIDTARGYTVSEGFLGHALKGRRDQFILATKSMAKTFDEMTSEVERSLTNLQTDYIDLYQLHLVKDMDDYKQVMSDTGAYKALVEAKEAGKIGHIGITAHSVDLMMDIIDDMPFETIQFPYNLVERQAEELFEKAHKRDIGVICMKPIAGGAIENGGLSIKFILQNKNVSLVIPGMEQTDEVYQNSLIATGNYVFTEKEKIEADKIVEELHGNFCRRCGYCAPCEVGINIPAMFIAEGYYSRYNMVGYATAYYAKQPVKASACIECGKCLKRCPYNLPIIDKMKDVSKVFGE
ncbi:MAG: aldo/keto reductase [Clostridiales bacterium]|nr:aldo/keto reductase [Clostridiales bacterium]